jgi:Skp family chaperone for outer membrane proteins
MAYPLFQLACLSGVILLAASSLSVGDEAASADRSNSGHRVGVIDIRVVLDNYEKLAVLKDELSDMEKSLLEGVQAKSQEAAKLQKELQSDTYKEGSPEFIRVQKRLSQLAGEITTAKNDAGLELARAQARAYQTVWDDCKSAMEVTCQKLSFDMLLQLQTIDAQPGVNPLQVIQIQIQQPVAYYKPENDVTPIVARYMNNRYKRAQEKAVEKTSGGEAGGKRPVRRADSDRQP